MGISVRLVCICYIVSRNVFRHSCFMPAPLVLFLLVFLVAPCVAQVQFVNVTQRAGIQFTHHSGATGKKYLPESLGSGCAFVDLDNDGWADILLVNGRDWQPSAKHYHAALYHNNHNGTFTDVTAGSGLDIEIYGIGVAIADYDNDGRDDVYITALDGDHLFHNEGNGNLLMSRGRRDGQRDFGASAAWFDFDRDGKVDLVVANYVQWTAKATLVLPRWVH